MPQYLLIKNGRQVTLSSGHQPQFLTGVDTSKPINPGIGDMYYSTDLRRLLICLVSGTWYDVYSLTNKAMMRTFSFSEMAVVNGTWGAVTDPSQTDFDDAWVASAGEIENLSFNDLDEIKLPNLTLNAGTYSIKVVTRGGAASGILEVLYGTTSLGTVDQYNAAPTFNTVNTFTYSPTTRGTQDLRFRVNGHNVASSSFILAISRIQIIKTA